MVIQKGKKDDQHKESQIAQPCKLGAACGATRFVGVFRTAGSRSKAGGAGLVQARVP
jgi:hypothetical protein